MKRTMATEVAFWVLVAVMIALGLLVMLDPGVAHAGWRISRHG